MLVRIVRMHFTETGAAEFLAIFNSNKESIRNFEGCLGLELLRDPRDPLTYATISHWKDEASLENYRKSELFASVWTNVKTLFSARAEAFSLQSFIQVQ